MFGLWKERIWMGGDWGRDDIRGEDAVFARACCADGAAVMGEVQARAESKNKCRGHYLSFVELRSIDGT